MGKIFFEQNEYKQWLFIATVIQDLAILLFILGFTFNLSFQLRSVFRQIQFTTTSLSQSSSRLHKLVRPLLSLTLIPFALVYLNDITIMMMYYWGLLSSSMTAYSLGPHSNKNHLCIKNFQQQAWLRPLATAMLLIDEYSTDFLTLFVFVTLLAL